jgi:putative membrane protein
MPIDQFYAYLLHLVTGLVLVSAFTVIYLWVTPFDEIRLIRKGCIAPALSFGGTLIGFSWTVASGILHVPDYTGFLVWAAAATTIQVVAFLILTKLLPEIKTALESNNIAMGALIGVVGLSVGLINGACLS